MNKNGIVSIILILVSWVTFAQIGIGTTNPDASSALEINSNNKGLLIPRMTTIEMNAIVSPAVGLLVYDTDTKLIWSYNGSAWVKSSGGKFVDGVNPTLAVYNDGNVAIGRTSTSHKLHVTSLKNSDDSNTAVRIDADYDGSGSSKSTFAAAHTASNLGTGTIEFAIGTRSTIGNSAGGTIIEGDASRAEVNNAGAITGLITGSYIQINNSGTMASSYGDYIGITNSGNITTSVGDYIVTINEAGKQIDYAFSSYLFVDNNGSMKDVFGQYIDYGGTGGTVTNSYGLVISSNFNKGTVDNFAIFSASDADSYLVGNLGVGVRAPLRKVHISGAMRLEPQVAAPADGELGDLYVGTDGNLYFNDGAGWKVVQVI